MSAKITAPYNIVNDNTTNVRVEVVSILLAMFNIPVIKRVIIKQMAVLF